MTLNQLLGKKILFVCGGNTCRSPMAEYMAIEMAKQKKLNIEFASRGTYESFSASDEPEKVSERAKKVVSEIYPNTKIANHISQKIEIEDLLEYDLILTMTKTQKWSIMDEIRKSNAEIGLKKYEKIYDKLATLREHTKELTNIPLHEEDIFDPMGSGVWDKNYLIGNNLMRILSGEAYERKWTTEKGEEEILIFDPVYESEQYKKCRDEIKVCLEKLLS